MTPIKRLLFIAKNQGRCPEWRSTNDLCSACPILGLVTAHKNSVEN